MRTLRKLPAASLSVGRRHFPPSRQTPDAPLRIQATGQLFLYRDSKRGPWPMLGCAHCPQRLQGPPSLSPLDAANCARSERPWTS
jgi:hypothetical protein